MDVRTHPLYGKRYVRHKAVTGIQTALLILNESRPSKFRDALWGLSSIKTNYNYNFDDLKSH